MSLDLLSKGVRACPERISASVVLCVILLSVSSLRRGPNAPLRLQQLYQHLYDGYRGVGFTHIANIRCLSDRPIFKMDFLYSNMVPDAIRI
jgi:hypothetical protein